jgi:hypothetical protein
MKSIVFLLQNAMQGCNGFHSVADVACLGLVHATPARDSE